MLLQHLLDTPTCTLWSFACAGIDVLLLNVLCRQALLAPGSVAAASSCTA